MTKNDFKSVKQFLRSIRYTEEAIKNLQRAIEDLDTRRESPPTWMTKLEQVPGRTNTNTSRQQTWVEFLDDYESRRSFLVDELAKSIRKIEQYHQAMETLAAEPVWGSLGAHIIAYKYYRGIKPDRAIFTFHLFCSEETFYRAHRRALQAIFEMMPDRFAKLTVS